MEKRNLSTNRQKPARLAEECFRSSLVGARRASCSSFPRESLRIRSQMLEDPQRQESARTKASFLLPGPLNKCFLLLLPRPLTQLHKHSACGAGLGFCRNGSQSGCGWHYLTVPRALALGVFSALASSAMKKGGCWSLLLRRKLLGRGIL